MNAAPSASRPCAAAVRSHMVRLPALPRFTWRRWRLVCIAKPSAAAALESVDVLDLLFEALGMSDMLLAAATCKQWRAIADAKITEWSLLDANAQRCTLGSSRGSAPGLFDGPAFAIALAEGALVSDSHNDRLVETAVSATFVCLIQSGDFDEIL